MFQPNKFYYNLSLYNDTLSNVRAQLQNTQQVPIIMNPSEWQGSIVRFTVSANWPLFIPTIPDPAFPTVTNLSITLSYGNAYFQQFIDITSDESKNGVFDIGIFLNDLNNAAAIAWNNMTAAFPASTAAYPPFFALDAPSGLISMYVDSGWLDDTVPTPSLIWMNSFLQDLLGLPANLRLPPPQPNGADYNIAIKDYSYLIPAAGIRYGYPYALNTRAGDILQVSQEYDQLSELSDISTIQFSSNLLPVVPESVPINPGVSQNGLIQGNTDKVVTDFVISRLDAKPRDNSFVYLPTAEYRRFSLLGNVPIRNIDIQASFTRYNSSNPNPLFLPPGGSMTLKLLFERIRS